jgi:hypothetical protein
LEYDRVNPTNTFTNISQPTSGLNNTGFGLPIDRAYRFNDGSLLNENSIVDQDLFMLYGNYNPLLWNQVPMLYGNYDMLPPNEITLPGFGYDQGYQDQFMFPQNITVDNNKVPILYGNYDMSPPNEIALPGFGYDQGYQDQFMFPQNITVDNNFQQFDNIANMIAFPAAANVPTGPMAAVQAPPTAIQPVPGQRVTCTVCLGTFSRTSDLTRHLNSVHHIGPRVLHLCTVLGCPKSFGPGYSRQDKLKEHLKKAHRL